MSRDLIVDGYNLARSGAVLLSADPVSPEGRAELCAILSAYSRGKGFRLTVVFDARGRGTSGRTRHPLPGGIALYSSGSESADDAIRDLCRRASAGAVVVTSDRGLAGTLPSRNVTVVSCGEFAERLAAHPMEGIQGAVEEGGPKERRAAKKGEGRRKKKRERGRGRILGKL